MVELPEEDYTADIRFVSKDFAELINQLSIFGDKLELSCDDDIVLNSENEFGKVDITVKENDIVEYIMEEGVTLKTSYGIKFITMITKFSNLNKELLINVTEGLPIKLTYNLDDWKEKDSCSENCIDNYICLYLAPLLDD